MRDAQLAVETGVDGLDIVIGTSNFLREHSHGKDMAYITKTALEVIGYVKSKGLEVRCESLKVSKVLVLPCRILLKLYTTKSWYQFTFSIPCKIMHANLCKVSSEDSFRSDLVDLLSLYKAVDKVGVNRVGVADTVGCASPRQVYEVWGTANKFLRRNIGPQGYSIAFLVLNGFRSLIY